MTQENKELLLRDLCGRLPYGVKAYIKNWSKLDMKYYEGVYTVESIDPSLNTIFADSERSSVEVIVGYYDYEIKPYLFPLSSMTREQLFEVQEILGKNEIKIEDGFLHIVDSDRNTITYLEILALLNWFYKNHFDINGLISMDLAIDASELNIYKTSISNNPQITIGTKICLKSNPDEILTIISDDCHEDKFECSDGSVLSLKQIKKYYDII